MYDQGNQTVREELARKVAALQEPRCYPEKTGRIEAIETHMAWVFLTAEHAYKLKKPVRTPLLDYRSLEQRRSGCLTEVRLNRRLAAQVYLGVVAVTKQDGRFYVDGTGPPVDWLVKMKRLPRRRMLDACIERKELLPEEIDGVTELLCRFYARTEKAGLSPGAYREGIADEITEKAQSLRRPRYALGSTVVDGAEGRLQTWLGHCSQQLEARADCVVDAHGDLRPEHICLLEKPVIIDCLEFSRSLRLLDPISELSFLALECRRLGAVWAGERILERYTHFSDDRPSSQLISFYMGYHALVRAAVALWHLDDDMLDDDDKWRQRARWYLKVVEEDVHPGSTTSE